MSIQVLTNMRYFLAIMAVVAIVFVWQVPTDKQENVDFDKPSTSQVVLEEKTVSPTDNQPPTTKIPADKEVIQDNEVVNKLIDQDVPFTSQAPFGGWEDERQQDGCEEASALMAIYWLRGESLSKLVAWQKIIAISDFQQKNYGEYRDIALTDVIDHIFKDYFKYDQVDLKNNITINDIIVALNNGNLVLAPMDGQKLNNPYFTAPGPERHMLVIRGYDPATKEFITNDPGTKRGEAYRYNETVLFEAIRAYPTGYHEPIDKIEKNIIIVSK